MKTFQEFFAEAEISGFARVTRGAAPAQATTASIRGAVDRALANSGQAQSASSKKGGMKTTVSGNVNVSGKFKIGGSKKSEKKKPEPESETRKPREVTKPTARKPREVASPGAGSRATGKRMPNITKNGQDARWSDLTSSERSAVTSSAQQSGRMPDSVQVTTGSPRSPRSTVGSRTRSVF
jgi:hypothetical protein|tara:strand:+ start:142 stop:684 length:543 start_codon:yes stop_codon:yes gene_type:complete